MKIVKSFVSLGLIILIIGMSACTSAEKTAAESETALAESKYTTTDVQTNAEVSSNDTITSMESKSMISSKTTQQSSSISSNSSGNTTSRSTVDMNTYDLSLYTQPFWKGNTVYHESVSFIQDDDGNTPPGKLLFNPTQILSVRSSDLQTEYQEKRDYILKDGKIFLTPNSRIQAMSYAEYMPFYASDAAKDWLVSATDPSRYIAVTDQILKYQIAVTYTHEDQWKGYCPPSQLEHLPQLQKKLNKKEALTVVFYGDSITAGWEASGADETCINMDSLLDFHLSIRRFPFMPTWSQMVCDRLQAVYSIDDLVRINHGAGGATSAWGKENARLLLNQENPDLVVIAFGMNQATVSGNALKEDIKAIIETVHSDCPLAEFLLVSCMIPNTDAATFSEHQLRNQERALYELQTEMTKTSIAVAPVYTMTQNLLNAGKAYGDLSGNNLNHPNDYTIRVYAQTILATLGIK